MRLTPMRHRAFGLLVVMLALAPCTASAQFFTDPPTPGECADAVARAQGDARRAAREGILGVCGRAGRNVLAAVVRGAVGEADQDLFLGLAEISPRSGLIFDAAMGLASNPAARPEARVGAMRVLAKQLVGSGGVLDVMDGMTGLAGPSPFCHVAVVVVTPGAGDTTSADYDRLSADYPMRVRTSMETIALDPANHIIVRNAAHCVRKHFKPAMIEPLDASTIQISNVCDMKFRIRNSGTRRVLLTFDVVGAPGRTNFISPVGDSFILAVYPGVVRLYYGDRQIDSARSSGELCPTKPA